MLRTILIEDENPAMEMLEHTLSIVNAEVKIIAKLRSVRESIHHFSSCPDADLIFCDVQLSDGLSFEIFKQAAIKMPVIFTTGYDEFMMMAFEYNGIDYLLKPVSSDEVEKALKKYLRFQNHFLHSAMPAPLETLVNSLSARKKTRLLVRQGMEHLALKIEDIKLIYIDNKVVYVIDCFSKKYIADKTLSELEEELDRDMFFRANRQYIVNINHIKSFKPFEKVKLAVDLNAPETNHNITISQETAPAFRKWMYDA